MSLCKEHPNKACTTVGHPVEILEIQVCFRDPAAGFGDGTSVAVVKMKSRNVELICTEEEIMVLCVMNANVSFNCYVSELRHIKTGVVLQIWK